MRYMPRLRSPVSGSSVTTHGSVMKRPPSSGQHFRMGRLRSVGGVGLVGGKWAMPGGSEDGGWRMEDGFPDARALPSSIFNPPSSFLKRWITSLHAPLFTVFGLA